MADRKRGHFITLEGGEGVGKSTLQSALAARLAATGLEVVTTREPGGTPLAELVRELALHPPRGNNWSPMAEALLMNAARSDHLDKVVRPALESGKWVICDRFSDSTRVYQSVKGGVPIDVLKGFEEWVIGETQPDLTFVLDAPPSTTDARRLSRDQAKDSFETRSSAFHAEVRAAFIDLAKSEPERCRLIDASQPAAVVADTVWSDIQGLLSQKISAR
ncbi:dTMP kinase [Hyphomonas sp.]|uniref:dTMP kinase n=1 Tax=Hyphomonas sp. TaxID=87 RepID=UPI003D2B68CA|tara:strand:- start:2754 stop:3410 length:657 start_codon:yes stop_codon:yes gene_type:complete